MRLILLIFSVAAPIEGGWDAAAPPPAPVSGAVDVAPSGWE